MSNDSENGANPWQNLSTISTFDKGNSTRTTRRLDEANDGAVGGQIVGRVAPSTSLLIESLLKNICTIFEPDSRRRNKLYYILCDKLHEMRLIDSSYNMMEFESIRGEYQQAWYQMVKVARAAAGSENIIDSPNFSPTSRYSIEFNELGFIASGGFGSVYRAMNHLDGHEYAIKKIIVRLSRVKSVRQQLEEVKTLAKLNHTNIVAYKGAWIEYNLPSAWNPNYSNEHKSRRQPRGYSQRSSVSRIESNSRESYTKSYQSKTSSSSDRGQNDNSKSHIGMYKKNSFEYRPVSDHHCSHCSLNHGDIINQRFQQFNSPIDIIGRRIVDMGSSGDSCEKQNSDVVSFRNDEDGDNNNNDRSVSSDGNEVEEIDEGRLEVANCVSDGKICAYNSSLVRSQYATLYIQMSLCEKNLRVWLDDRRDVTPEPVSTMILKQILDGIHYMHSRGVVHHDIKPSNIFIAASGQRVEIQVGDFGLACPLQRENHGPIFGTELYVAPEQLNGECNFKSDLYSVGIVAFEILFPMQTAMERDILIKKLKTGKLPDNFIAEHPKWAEIIRKLVHSDPHRRPSTTDLLRELHEDKDTIIANLENSNREKDTIIENMKRERDSIEQVLRRENEELKSRLLSLETYIKSLKGTDL